MRSDGRASLYLGPGLRLGGHASLIGGIAVGPTSALPAGVHERSPVTDTNFLVNLDSRISKSWFAALTYTFTSVR